MVSLQMNYVVAGLQQWPGLRQDHAVKVLDGASEIEFIRFYTSVEPELWCVNSCCTGFIVKFKMIQIKTLEQLRRELNS